MPLRIWVISLFILSALIPFVPAQSQPASPSPIGTIVEIEGSAAITHPGQKPITAVTDAPIYQNDILETGSSSKMDVLFTDDTEFTLGENTRMKIDEYIYDSNAPAGNKGVYSVLNGVFLYIGGLMADHTNPNVTVETSYASIGMRGTTVWGGPLDGEFGVLVQEGAVDVKTDQGAVRVNAGGGTNIRGRNFIPSAVKAWPSEKIARAQHTIALKRHEMVRQRVQAMKANHLEMRARRKELLEHRKIEKKTERIDDMQLKQKREAIKEGFQKRNPKLQPHNLQQRQKQSRD